MSEPIVLDNTILLEAADALDREARIVELHASLDAHDTVEAMVDAARQLRDIADRAENGPARASGYRAVAVLVQGVTGRRVPKKPRLRTVEVRRG